MGLPTEYSGVMLKGTRHGIGVLKRADGSSYEDQFFNNLEQDKGIVQRPRRADLGKGKVSEGKL